MYSNFLTLQEEEQEDLEIWGKAQRESTRSEASSADLGAKRRPGNRCCPGTAVPTRAVATVNLSYCCRRRKDPPTVGLSVIRIVSYLFVKLLYIFCGINLAVGRIQRHLCDEIVIGLRVKL